MARGAVGRGRGEELSGAGLAWAEREDMLAAATLSGAASAMVVPEPKEPDSEAPVAAVPSSLPQPWFRRSPRNQKVWPQILHPIGSNPSCSSESPRSPAAWPQSVLARRREDTSEIVGVDG